MRRVLCAMISLATCLAMCVATICVVQFFFKGADRAGGPSEAVIFSEKEMVRPMPEAAHLEALKRHAEAEKELLAEREPETTLLKLTFAGDCMLASYKGQVHRGSFSSKALEGDWEYFLEVTDDYFENDDFSIVNLENVLTDDRSLCEVLKDHDPAYWYKGPTDNINILSSQSIEVAGLANNHYGDYGEKGRSDTRKACESAGLLWGDNEHTVYLEKDGFVVALICHGLWNEGQAEHIISRLNDAKESSDYQVVYYHGGTEGVHSPEEWRINASRRLVDAGADLVIGNHPHVLQPREIYNGVEIIYSMGNFCYGGSSRPENRTILYTVELEFDNQSRALTRSGSEIIPCYVYTGETNNWQPAVITDEAIRQRVLDFMDQKAASPI